MSDNSRRYSDEDPAGAMVGGMIMLLDYAASIRDDHAPRRKTERWVDKVTDKMREDALLHAKEAEEDCRELEAIIKKRGKVELGARDVAYFRSIFEPYAALIKIASLNHRDGPNQDEPRPDPVPLSPNLLRMLPTAARGLLTLKRLLEPPSTWHEAEIFRKEREYAELVAGDPSYLMARARFYSDCEKAGVHNMGIVRGNRITEEHLLSLYNASQSEACQEGVTEEEAYRLDRLRAIPFEAEDILRRFCLQEFSLHGVVPLWFDIRAEQGRLTIQIPNYMGFDWSRSIPKDVARHLRRDLPKSAVDEVQDGWNPRADVFIWMLFVITTASMTNRSPPDDDPLVEEIIETMDSLLMDSPLACSKAIDKEDRCCTTRKRLDDIPRRCQGREAELVLPLDDPYLLAELFQLLGIDPEEHEMLSPFGWRSTTALDYLYQAVGEYIAAKAKRKGASPIWVLLSDCHEIASATCGER